MARHLARSITNKSICAYLIGGVVLAALMFLLVNLRGLQETAMKTTPELHMEYVNPAALKPRPSNPRVHSKRQIKLVEKSIGRFGFTAPLIAEDDGQIIAGHARWQAAINLGLKRIPVVKVGHLTAAEVKALVIADNRLTDLSEFDRALVLQELDAVVELDPDFEIVTTGFDIAEMEALREIGEETSASKLDQPPPLEQSVPPVTQIGDVWEAGAHRIYCGDATKPESYSALMAGAKAQMVFTDPPYNVEIAGFVSGKGKVQHREFVQASGEMTPAEYGAFLHAYMYRLAENSISGSIHYHCIDWRHVHDVIAAGNRVYLELKTICVWTKTNASMGSFYRNQHEFVCVFKSGHGKHINTFQLGQHGRSRTTVWRYAGANTFGPGRSEDLHLHPTCKPVALVADAIRDCSRKGGIILDPFSGAGSTVIAAETTGRRAYVMDLDARYVDVTIRRWQALTGEPVYLAGTKESFAQISAKRTTAPMPSAPTRKRP